MKSSNSLRVREYLFRPPPKSPQIAVNSAAISSRWWFPPKSPPNHSSAISNRLIPLFFGLIAEIKGGTSWRLRTPKSPKPPYTSLKSLDSLKSAKIPAEIFGSSVAIAVFFKPCSYEEKRRRRGKKKVSRREKERADFFNNGKLGLF